MRWKAQVVVASREALEADDSSAGVCFITKPVHGATLVHLVRDLINRASEPEPESAEIVRSPSSRRPEILTPRQQEVLDLLAQGKSTAAIARAMGLSVNTVRVHLIAAYRILGVSSRVEAVLATLRQQQAQQHPTIG
jgi:DNA-binding NarL/FixJ family response regulator